MMNQDSGAGERSWQFALSNAHWSRSRARARHATCHVCTRCIIQVGRQDQRRREEDLAANSTTGVLPYQAVSVVALLALLLRWSMCAERMGGMREERGRQSCGEMLQSMLEACYGSAPWTCVIALDDEWQNPWPRPETSPAVCTFQVLQGGIMVEGCLQPTGVDQEHMNPVATRWETALARECNGDMSLMTVLRSTSGNPALRSLHRQLVWHLGRHVHQLVMRTLKGQVVPVVSASEVTIADMISNPDKLDVALVRYVASCRSATSGHTVLSLATDKSSVNGLQLQNSVIVLRNGSAIVTPPQVPFVSG